jgi:hypothetical protein
MVDSVYHSTQFASPNGRLESTVRAHFASPNGRLESIVRTHFSSPNGRLGLPFGLIFRNEQGVHCGQAELDFFCKELFENVRNNFERKGRHNISSTSWTAYMKQLHNLH